jgi:hypothetical protein
MEVKGLDFGVNDERSSIVSVANQEQIQTCYENVTIPCFSEAPIWRDEWIKA